MLEDSSLWSRRVDAGIAGAYVEETQRRPRRRGPSWRTRSGVEVDFVLYGSGGFWAVEVKNTRRIRSQDLRGLKSFRADYPECEAMFLYRGEERLVVEGVRCLGVEDFLRQLHPAHGLTESDDDG